MDERTITINLTGRGLRWLAVSAAVLALTVPAVAWASHQFTDVPDSNIFHDDIDWMADNGVTKGCNPPENTRYCPDDNVTREQMAAFMHRLETEGVFLTPEAAGAVSHYAVVDSDGTVLFESGLDSVTHTDVGDFVLTWDTDVSECGWTGTIGARNGGVISQARTITLNGGGSTEVTDIDVKIMTGADVDVDNTFNVAVHC